MFLISVQVEPRASFTATHEYTSESCLFTGEIGNLDATTRKPSIIVTGSTVPLNSILAAPDPRYQDIIGDGKPLAMHVSTAALPSTTVITTSAVGLVMLAGAIHVLFYAK